jgi:hypothetical protein
MEKPKATRDLPATELPFGAEDNGGPATALPFGVEDNDCPIGKEDSTAAALDVDETTTGSLRSGFDGFEDPEGHQGREGPGRRPGDDGSAQLCCQCAADAALAALAVTSVATAVLVVRREPTLVGTTIMSALFALIWNMVVCDSSRSVRRSALASVPFFFFDAANLAVLFGGCFWCVAFTMAGLAPFIVLGIVGMTRDAVKGVARRCTAVGAAMRQRRPPDGGGFDGDRDDEPSRQPPPPAALEPRAIHNPFALRLSRVSSSSNRVRMQKLGCL